MLQPPRRLENLLRRTYVGIVIHKLALIGDPPEHRDFHGQGFYPVINENARIEAFCTVDAGTERPTQIGASWAMKGCHVGHDARIGDGCELAPHVCVGGFCELGDNVRVGMGATIRNRVKIGAGARIGMGAAVVKNVPAGEVWAGVPARPLQVERGESDLDIWMEWYDSWHQPSEVRDYFESLRVDRR